MASRDPLHAGRENPEVGELLRVIRNKWKEFTAETHPTRRRGHAAVLCALLQQYLDEPDMLPPEKTEGVLDNPEAWIPDSQFDGMAPPFLDVHPFARPGEFSALYFFATATGCLSRLYQGKPVFPQIKPLTSHGPFVYTLELLFASEAPTTCTLQSAETAASAIKRRRMAPMGEGENRYFILVDPRGCRSKRTYSGFIIGDTGDYAAARRAAIAGAARLNVRLIVARVIYAFCTR